MTVISNSTAIEDYQGLYLYIVSVSAKYCGLELRITRPVLLRMSVLLLLVAKILSERKFETTPGYSRWVPVSTTKPPEGVAHGVSRTG